jgi:hypothetical protein
MNTGTIVQVDGPVVDVAFPDALPAITNALTVEYTVLDRTRDADARSAAAPRRPWVRTISMSGTEGLKRGYKVTDSGGPIPHAGWARRHGAACSTSRALRWTNVDPWWRRSTTDPPDPRRRWSISPRRPTCSRPASK